MHFLTNHMLGGLAHGVGTGLLHAGSGSEPLSRRPSEGGKHDRGTGTQPCQDERSSQIYTPQGQ